MRGTAPSSCSAVGANGHPDPIVGCLINGSGIATYGIFDATPRNQQRRINRRVELRLRFSKIFDRYDVGVPRQQLAYATSGERSPQFGRHQIRHDATRSQQIPRALNEQRSQIDLGSEASSGARAFGTALPGRAPIDSEFLFQALA